MSKEFEEYEGLINRVAGIFGVLKYFPDDMSDEEVEGFLHVLPQDVANTLTAMLAPRRVRKASIAWLKCLQEWFDGALAAKKEARSSSWRPSTSPPSSCAVSRTRIP